MGPQVTLTSTSPFECAVNISHRITSHLPEVITVLQQNRLKWYWHVLRKDWVKKCTEYEVECARSKGRPKKTWTEIVQKDCQCFDAVDSAAGRASGL